MEYTHLTQEPGIYLITNTRNGRYYVGSTVNLYKRVAGHRRELQKGTHGNSFLQRAWDKNGKDAFTVSVLELVSDRKDLPTREQAWLDMLYDKVRSYNILPMAYSTSGFQRPPRTKKSLEASSWAKARPVEGFVTPEGYELTILNVGLFCRENDLSPEVMYAMAGGKVTSYKGWIHKNGKPKQREWINRYEGFIDPSGVEIPAFENLQAFCRGHGLDHASMYKVIQGKARQHKGWTYAPDAASIEAVSYKQRE